MDDKSETQHRFGVRPRSLEMRWASRDGRPRPRWISARRPKRVRAARPEEASQTYLWLRIQSPVSFLKVIRDAVHLRWSRGRIPI